MLLGVLNDIRAAMSTFLLDKKEYKEKVPKMYEQQIKLKLETMEKFMKDKNEFALGYLTIVDFLIA
jgi:hypothetical protein